MPRVCRGYTEAEVCGNRIPLTDCNGGGVHETFAKTHCPFMCGVDCTAAESTTDAGSVSEIPDGAAVTNQDDEGSYAPVYAIYSGNAGNSAAATGTALAMDEQNYFLDTTANLSANSTNT